MEIEIIRSDFNYLIKQEKAVWKSYLKRTIVVPIVFIITGFFFFLDALDIYMKTGSFVCVSFSLSLGLLVAAISIIIHELILRHAGLKNVKEYMNSLKKYNESITIKITGWGIISKSSTSTSEFSWPFFQTFRVIDDHIFLIPAYHRYEKMVIRKTEITVEQYDKLLDFLEKKYST